MSNPALLVVTNLQTSSGFFETTYIFMSNKEWISLEYTYKKVNSTGMADIIRQQLILDLSIVLRNYCFCDKMSKWVITEISQLKPTVHGTD